MIFVNHYRKTVCCILHTEYCFLSLQTMTRSERQELIDKGLLLPLMEEFYTIQGEGFHKGTAAYFVRIGGCEFSITRT